MTKTFFVDVWSDVVCPFCYLGARQLTNALDGFEHRDDVTLRHRAFELDPHAPRDSGQTLDERLAMKYAMPIERARSLNEKLESDAAAMGMTWSMKLARPTNTFDAHRLIALASTQGLGGAMSERLFRAYFSEGQLLGDTDTLNALATDVGVGDADKLWQSDDLADDVRADEDQANELGITGVPTMLFDDKFMVVGAQGSERILDVLTRAWTRR
ncbi:MAG: DsbA family oxidoreductase [Acidimicrobiales bacterium]|jgi:predicted DsbA family dithiol-disulfide isomerase